MERPCIAAIAQPQPGRRRPARRGRSVCQPRLGGRLHRQQDPDPGLERRAWTHAATPSPAAGSQLNGVAATSATSAWAVGAAGSKPLVERWDGTAWTQVPSPNPPAAGGSYLTAVAATSARSAWAVGAVGTGPGSATLILRWNGTAWKRVPSPGPAGSVLRGVAATSPANAWAVGYTGTGKTLIEHWNGTAWSGSAARDRPAATSPAWPPPRTGTPGQSAP